MLEYRDKVVREIVACTCDRCGRSLPPNDDDWHEKLTVEHRGYFSAL